MPETQGIQYSPEFIAAVEEKFYLRPADKASRYKHTRDQIDVFKKRSHSTSDFPPYCRVMIYLSDIKKWARIHAKDISSISMTNGINQIGTADIEISVSEERLKRYNLLSDTSEFGRTLRTRRTQMKIIMGYGSVRFNVFEGWLMSYEMSANGESKVKVRFNCVNRLSELQNDLARRLGEGRVDTQDTDIGKDPDEPIVDPTDEFSDPVMGNGAGIGSVNDMLGQDDGSYSSDELNGPPSLYLTPSYNRLYVKFLDDIIKKDYPFTKRIVSPYKLFNVNQDVHMTFAVSEDGEKGTIYHVNVTQKKLVRKIKTNHFRLGQYVYDSYDKRYVHRDYVSGSFITGYFPVTTRDFKNELTVVVPTDGTPSYRVGRLGLDQHSNYVTPEKMRKSIFAPYQNLYYGNDFIAQTSYESVYGIVLKTHIDTQYFTEFVTPISQKITPLPYDNKVEDKGYSYSIQNNSASARMMHANGFSASFDVMMLNSNKFELVLSAGGVNYKSKVIGTIKFDRTIWNQAIFGVPPETTDESYFAQSLFLGPKRQHPQSTVDFYTSPLIAMTGYGTKWFMWMAGKLVYLNFRTGEYTFFDLPNEIVNASTERKIKGISFDSFFFTKDQSNRVGAIVTRKDLMFVLGYDYLGDYDPIKKELPWMGQDAMVFKVNFSGTIMEQEMEEEFRVLESEAKEISDYNPGNPTIPEPTYPDIKSPSPEDIGEQAEKETLEDIVSGEGLYPVGEKTPLQDERDIANKNGMGIFVDNGSGTLQMLSFRPKKEYPDYIIEEGVDLLSIQYASNDTIYSKVEVIPRRGKRGLRTRATGILGETGEELRLYRPDLTSEEAQKVADAYIDANQADDVEIEIRFVPLLDVGMTVLVKCGERLNNHIIGVVKESSVSYNDEGAWMTLRLMVFDYRVLPKQ